MISTVLLEMKQLMLQHHSTVDVYDRQNGMYMLICRLQSLCP